MIVRCSLAALCLMAGLLLPFQAASAQDGPKDERQKKEELKIQEMQKELEVMQKEMKAMQKEMKAMKAEAEKRRATIVKVGLVNIGTIFHKFKKVEMFKDDFEKELKPYRDEETKLKKVAADWEAALKGDKLSPEDRTRGEKVVIEANRRLEDLKREYKEKVAKKTEEHLVQLFREVNDGIKAYAEAQGIDLILGYGEPVEGNLMSFVNVTRKMQAMDQGSVVPMYFSNSLDISQPVIDNLNRNIVRPAPRQK